ncbi:hypothetical protein, partial [Salmonella sp. SAL4457]|uniref:hypothetical protein n=1 Tax=Salmonella sp. SAL4457 TaxID=3159912 RepID=UPI00397AEFCB
YILLAIGWMFLIIVLFPRSPTDFARGMAMFSPLFSTGTLSSIAERDGSFQPGWEYNSQAFGLFWTVVYVALALGLFGVTLA